MATGFPQSFVVANGRQQRRPVMVYPFDSGYSVADPPLGRQPRRWAYQATGATVSTTNRPLRA